MLDSGPPFESPLSLRNTADPVRPNPSATRGLSNVRESLRSQRLIGNATYRLLRSSFANKHCYDKQTHPKYWIDVSHTLLVSVPSGSALYFGLPSLSTLMSAPPAFKRIPPSCLLISFTPETRGSKTGGRRQQTLNPCLGTAPKHRVPSIFSLPLAPSSEPP